jgi:hypothetical protein
MPGYRGLDDEFRRDLERLGADPHDISLLALAQRYSYVLPDEQALAMLGSLGPVIEIGAGTGYWAHQLKTMGVDIIAFDKAPPDGPLPNRYHQEPVTWTQVLPGDQSVLPGHPDRALFVCWPPLISTLGDCLSCYHGDIVAYIGDNGYRTARLDILDTHFRRVAASPVRALDPFPGSTVMLGVWQRVHRAASGPARASRAVR